MARQNANVRPLHISTGTWPPVTEPSRTCQHSEDTPPNPHFPIRYDADLNEYSMVWRIGDGYGAMMIYHCPFCGGRTPKSRRDQLFADVPQSEYERLAQLTAGIASIDE